jgi:hypothetical protein
MRKFVTGGAIAALAFAFSPAANAVTNIFHVGDPNFQITSGSPTSPSITAVFFNGFEDSVTFDDSFLFTIPQNGEGSGSISTSFSAANKNMLVITDLIINGVTHSIPTTPSGQAFSVSGIPIVANVLNTIEVKGFTVGSGTYSGTATFAVPEPASWMMMILGFGAVSLVLRRRQKQNVRTRISFS